MKNFITKTEFPKLISDKLVLIKSMPDPMGTLFYMDALSSKIKFYDPLPEWAKKFEIYYDKTEF